MPVAIAHNLETQLVAAVEDNNMCSQMDANFIDNPVLVGLSNCVTDTEFIHEKTVQIDKQLDRGRDRYTK